MGRKLFVRVHLAAYSLQEVYDLTDRQVEYGLNDNAAYQLFSGKGIVAGRRPPDHTKVEEFGRVFQLGRIKGNFLYVLASTSLRVEDKQSFAPMLAEHQASSMRVKWLGRKNLCRAGRPPNNAMGSATRSLATLGIVSGAFAPETSYKLPR